MLSFEELLAVAKKERDGIDTFEEYKDAILFYGEHDEDSDGGDQQTIVVLKTTGKAMYIYELVQAHLSSKIDDNNFVRKGKC